MTCSVCATANPAGSAFCISCGNRLVETAPPADTQPAAQPAPLFLVPPKKKLGAGAIVAIVAGALVVLLGVGIGGTVAIGAAIAAKEAQTYVPDITDTDTDTDTGTDWVDEPVVTDWAPAGFTQWDDDIAYRFATDENTSDCSDCTYWFIEVYANNDCSNGVYAAMNFEDAYETVVDWSNDTLPALYAGQTGLLEFDHYPYEDDMTGRLTDLTCHP